MAVVPAADGFGRCKLHPVLAEILQINNGKA